MSAAPVTERRPALPLRPYLVGVGMLAALVVICYFAFHPALPFTSGYRVDALFKSSNGLRTGSPVRIAGINAGKVISIDDGPGSTTKVTMEIAEDARPIKRDATARIVPRVFLEGGFAVDLRPGTPSAAAIPDNGTIPLAQTTTPVQFHQLLTAFDAPTRDSMQSSIGEFATAFSGGGAEGLGRVAPELKPLLRDMSWVAEASQGREVGDLASLIASSRTVTAALDANPGQIGDLVANFASASEAFAAEDTAIAEGINRSSRVLAATPAALRATDRLLPRLERAGSQIAPALPLAPDSLRATTRNIRDIARLSAPSRRERTVGSMRTALVELPELLGSLARTLPASGPLSECLGSHVVPLFKSEVPDGTLSSGRPVWQDFAHATVGLSGGSQNFDGNGHSLRYQLGLGGSSISAGGLLNTDPLITNAPAQMRSRPLARSDGKAPPLNGSAKCSDQPQPVLATASGGAGLRSASRERAEPLTLRQYRKLIRPSRLRKALRRAK